VPDDRGVPCITLITRSDADLDREWQHTCHCAPSRARTSCATHQYAEVPRVAEVRSILEEVLEDIDDEYDESAVAHSA